MHALSDDEQLERMERKVDAGFAEMRAEFRAFRSEMGDLHRLMIQLFAGLFATMIFGFAGIVIAMLAHA
jgi:hypothetical protein